MTSDDLLFEIRQLLRGGLLRDERDRERTLRGCHKELLAGADNERWHELFFDLSARELRLLPRDTRSPLLLRLPLGDAASGLSGQAALLECVDILGQHLSIPSNCKRLHPEFFGALSAAAQNPP